MRTLQNDTVRSPLMGVLGACAALSFAGCAKQPETAAPVVAAPVVQPASSTESNSELNWAREALQRNPAIEVVATDTAAGVFTIRFRESGEMRAVKLNELAATPISTLSEPVHTTAAEPEPAATPSVAQPVERPAATAAAQASASTQPTPNYTIQREGGQLKVSGPGVSIVSTGAPAGTSTGSEANARSADPIICEGRRMLHFDNRNIYVQGDAIIARGGCELYITNSRVIAEGTGVVIADATVHIANSTIQGSAASFDASDAARVYVRGSTFEGLPRRAEHAVVQDQGGNQWR